ncbi:MAG: hypothetical protein KAJ10_07300 [Thermodesulfovibrionia bacterium]|nr:hypothetical protein [Thermodesulfovibrionia bacterium]
MSTETDIKDGDTFINGFGAILAQQSKEKQARIEKASTDNSLQNSIADVFASPREKELRLFFADVVAKEGLKPISLIFKNTKTSTAYAATRTVTAASWILKADKHPLFAKVHLLHEIAHHLLWDMKDENHAHNIKFQRVETALCRIYAKLIPIYGQDRGYCSCHVCMETHKVLFSWTGMTPDSIDFVIAREKF